MAKFSNWTGKIHPLAHLTDHDSYEVTVVSIMEKHDDVIKWKHFSRYWPFVRGIHRSPMNSLHNGQWRGALMLSLICVCINGWVNNREAGDLRRHRARYDVSENEIDHVTTASHCKHMALPSTNTLTSTPLTHTFMKRISLRETLIIKT